METGQRIDTVRIAAGMSISLPAAVVRKLSLDECDVLHVAVEKGRIVLTPLRVSNEAPALQLTLGEQWELARAKMDAERDHMRKMPMCPDPVRCPE